MEGVFQTDRIKYLKDKMLSEPRYASIEQALIITDSYKQHEDQPRIIQRALALKASLEKIKISAEPEELIVGNRTALGWIRSLRLFPQGCRISFMSIRRILKHLEKRLNPTGKESLWKMSSMRDMEKK